MAIWMSALHCSPARPTFFGSVAFFAHEKRRARSRLGGSLSEQHVHNHSQFFFPRKALFKVFPHQVKFQKELAEMPVKDTTSLSGALWTEAGDCSPPALENLPIRNRALYNCSHALKGYSKQLVKSVLCEKPFQKVCLWHIKQHQTTKFSAPFPQCCSYSWWPLGHSKQQWVLQLWSRQPQGRRRMNWWFVAETAAS